MELNLKDYQRGKNKFVVKTINLRQKNYLKLSKKNIDLSKLVNDFLESTENRELILEFNERVKDNKERVVTSLSIKSELVGKLAKINLSCLVNKLIESI